MLKISKISVKLSNKSPNDAAQYYDIEVQSSIGKFEDARFGSAAIHSIASFHDFNDDISTKNKNENNSKFVVKSTQYTVAKKRYSDFVKFHNLMTAKFPVEGNISRAVEDTSGVLEKPTLPPKSSTIDSISFLFNFGTFSHFAEDQDCEFIAERIKGLEGYLLSILNSKLKSIRQWRISKHWIELIGIQELTMYNGNRSTVVFEEDSANCIFYKVNSRLAEELLGSNTMSQTNNRLTNNTALEKWKIQQNEIESSLDDVERMLSQRDRQKRNEIRENETQIDDLSITIKKAIGGVSYRLKTQQNSLEKILSAVNHSFDNSTKKDATFISEGEQFRLQNLLTKTQARRDKYLKWVNSKSNEGFQRTDYQGSISFGGERVDLLNVGTFYSSSVPSPKTGRVFGKRIYDIDQTQEELLKEQNQNLQIQDQHIDSLHQSVRNQREIAVAMNNELTEQNEIIEDLDGRVDRTNNRINGLIKGTKKLL